LTLVGGNDQLIYPRGVLGDYRVMAARYGRRAGDFDDVQRFYRLFRARRASRRPGDGDGDGDDHRR
jgi:hypothetical protein